MKVILTMILGISLFPTVSIAHDDQALWVAKCRFGKYLVSIEAKSKSGDPSEDDMSIQIQIGKKKIPETIGIGLYRPLAPPKALNACDKTVGIPISKTQSLLLFAVDDRPSLDNLAGVLIDMTSGKILDSKMNLGSFSHEKEIKIEKSKYGFRALMVQGWNKAAKSDSIAEAHMGRVRVKIKDGRIFSSWEKPLPKTHNQY